MHKFEVYRFAARRVEQGWSRGWENSKGGVCGVTAILRVMQLDGDELPMDVLNDLDGTLMKYPSYQLIRVAVFDAHAKRAAGGWRRTLNIALGDKHPIQNSVMAWNDAVGTRRRVAKMLDALADEQEKIWRRAEHSRLQVEVQRLTEKVAALQTTIEKFQGRITALESENGRLRRLTHSAALLADRRELRRVDAMLDAQWDDLTKKQGALSLYD